MKNEQNSRTAMLLGASSIEKLAGARVAVFGVGGVGGYAAEALARAGVGALDLIDNDTVSVSNINRQMVATTETVGRLKVDVMAERIRAINPDCQVTALPTFRTKENAAELIASSGADAVVDCIDNVSAKIAMIVACGEQGRYPLGAPGSKRPPLPRL